MLGHKPRVAGIAHHASGYVLLLSLFTFLVSCASSPSAESTPAPPLILPQTPTPAPVLCYEAELPAALADESLSLFSAISSSDLIRGPADAATRFIIYGDYQDAASAEFHMLVKELAEKYPDALQVVFRDFPMFTLEGHEKAGLAAHAAQAAALQGKFWEMHDLLFEKQAAWTTLGYVAFIDWLVEEAQSFGVDGIVLKEDMQSQAVLDMVDQAYLSALDAGIPGTPFLLINGEIHDNLFNFYTFDRIIALNALAERQYTSCPPNVIEPEVEYLVSLRTEKGEVIIQLYPDEAPMAVNNFLFLVREGWYEGSSFHRVLPGYFAETGDPSGTGQGNPGYYFPNEISPNLKFDRPGVVAMKNIGEGTNGSQFFITYAAEASYDGRYTIFGQVLSGMEALKLLSPRDPQFGISLPEGDLLLDVTIVER